MSRVQSIDVGTDLQQRNEPVKRDAIGDVNLDQFLKLMITELQNQDPLNPLENDQLMAQIGQIRSIAATDKMTATLDTVLLGQNIASATNLIYADIEGISDDNQRVKGIVERVSVADGQPKLHLDLGPDAQAATNDGGALEEGEYQYRVVWDSGGVLVGVDPLAEADGGSGTVAVGEGGTQSVEISNLPVSGGTKQVFRRQGTDGQFQLVGTIKDGKKATFVDGASADELSGFVMPVEPQLINARREFTVSLSNVGEIKPPRVSGQSSLNP